MANEKPQYIGTKTPYVVIPKAQWQALSSPAQPLGQWLVDHLADVGELPLPNRADPEREVLFQGDFQ